jgi:hypothetical protein
MESKTLKALQFFYDRGPTPFIKLSNYLNEFSAEYRYLLATGMIERTHCGQMVEVTIAGRDAYERNNPSSKVNVISWIAIVLQFLNMILSPHDYSIPQMIKDCMGKFSIKYHKRGYQLELKKIIGRQFYEKCKKSHIINIVVCICFSCNGFCIHR